MSYNIKIVPGQDIEIDGTHATPLNVVEAYAIHLYWANGGGLITKLSNKAVTDYNLWLFDVALSATPATFKIKLRRSLTTLFKGKAGHKIDAVFYHQSTDADYDDSDFRPASEPTPFATIASASLITTNISP